MCNRRMPQPYAVLVKAGFLLYFSAIRAPAHPPIKLVWQATETLAVRSAQKPGKDLAVKDLDR